MTDNKIRTIYEEQSPPRKDDTVQSLFHIDSRVGLITSNLPNNVIQSIKEEDLEIVLSEIVSDDSRQP